MAERVRQGQDIARCKMHLDTFAESGLRTLLVAVREIESHGLQWDLGGEPQPAVRLLREARAHVGVSAGGVSAAARGARERGELAFGEPERHRGPARERAGLEERRVDGEFFPVV